MNNFLLILDSPLIKVILFSCIIGLALKSIYSKESIPQSLLCAIYFLFAFSFKWFTLYYNAPLHGDESFVYSSALTLVNIDPIPYRSVDFGTLGPLHAFSFVIPHYLGFDKSYTNFRFIWLIYWTLIQFFIYFSLKNIFDFHKAALFFIYPFTLASTSLISDFNHFYNESTSLLFLSAGLALFSINYKLRSHKNSLDYCIYMLCSISVFAKPHAAILAFTICIITLIQRIKSKQKISHSYLILSFISGIFMPAIFFIILIFYGVWDEFYFFYISTNSSYQVQSSLLERFKNIFIVRSTSEPFINYFVKHTYLFLAITFSSLTILLKKFNFVNLIILYLTISTIATIIKPGYAYGHYFNYLFLTFPFLIGGIYNFLCEKKYISYAYTVIIAITTTIFFAFSIRHSMYLAKSMKLSTNIGAIKEMRISSISKFLIKFAEDNDLKNVRMNVFDWRNELYIETGFMQATHYNMPERLLGYQASNLQVVERARRIYLDDLQFNKPEFFLVSTSNELSYWDMTTKALNKIPELTNFLSNNYILLREMDGIKIYLGKTTKTTFIGPSPDFPN